METNMRTAASVLPMPLRSVVGARQWLNTRPLVPEDFRGKVVLVNFWTYSCINSLRPLPYLRAWADKYGDRGLVVIGVHTPEFAFEHELPNVQEASSDHSVRFPVAIDSDYAIWNAFTNQAWPAFYIFDANGRLRHRKFGETGYAETERMIQQLLSETDGPPVSGKLVAPRGDGIEAPPVWSDIETSETYVGFARATNFSSHSGIKRNLSRLYTQPRDLKTNHWGLVGRWTVASEYARLDSSPGEITIRFHARDLHLVLGRSAREPIRFRVTLDGKAPGLHHGADTDANGQGVLDKDRLYQLIRQTGPIEDRMFEIRFEAPGARAYSFTFG